MKSNVVFLQGRASDLMDELKYLASQGESGLVRGLAYCYIDRRGEITIGIAGKLDADNMCDGLAELALHISQTKGEKS